MLKNTTRNMFIVIFIAALLVLMYGCGEKKAQATQTLGESQGKLQVKTAPVELQDFQSNVEASGTLVPARHAMLTTLVGGKLQTIRVDIGESVKRGDILFQVRTVDYELTLKQAEAGLRRAEIMVKDRQREMARIENLFKGGSATEQARDQAVTAFEDARSALSLAAASTDTAKQSLEDCTVKAPYDGTITAKFIQEGEFAKSGIEVLEIMDLTTLNAEIDVSERYAGKINMETAVRVSPSTGAEPLIGKITAINPKIDLGGRTFLVKVAVDNTDGHLQAGLFCTARFALPAAKNQTAIPAAALNRDQGRSTVWIIEDGKAYQKEVADNGIYDSRAWIVNGLHKGQAVVIEGAGSLTQGVEVEVKN